MQRNSGDKTDLQCQLMHDEKRQRKEKKQKKTYTAQKIFKNLWWGWVRSVGGIGHIYVYGIYMHVRQVMNGSTQRMTYFTSKKSRFKGSTIYISFFSPNNYYTWDLKPRLRFFNNVS